MRLFSKRQKRILKFLSANICCVCGIKLDKNFHADHIKAYSKGGDTTLINGQSLCQKCNLSKGSK